MMLIFAFFFTKLFAGPNQTDTLSPVYPANTLPFTLDVELADFQIPGGLQNFVVGVHKHKWLFLCGRTNGLHGFIQGSTTNFPPQTQNTSAYVFDLDTQQVYVKSLYDPSSGLSQAEIDSISITAPQFNQTFETLYVVGGYGVNTSTGTFSTMPILSAINVPGLIHWVENPSPGETAKSYIRQISDPIFKVTGGEMFQISPHTPFLLIFGHNFNGFYTMGVQAYTDQVRTFKLIDDGVNLAVFSQQYLPQNPNFRRRDLNIVPIIRKRGNTLEQSIMALSGVFTPAFGVWTVPVFIDAMGGSFMPDPSSSNTFKQAMNNYNSAHTGLYSKKQNQMHTILFGGLSYQIFTNGSFIIDPAIGFNNNITDVMIDNAGNITQYLFDAEFPVIPSNFSNPGNPLLFGTGAEFIPVDNLSRFPIEFTLSLDRNVVFSLDDLKERTLLGYVVGGIMSTLMETNDQSDSAASPYIFQVFATPN